MFAGYSLNGLTIEAFQPPTITTTTGPAASISATTGTTTPGTSTKVATTNGKTTQGT